jgi:enoyl-CoA hydratase/carnithine racemase
MTFFKVTNDQNIRTIQMNRGSSNPINLEFISELTQIIQQSKADESVKGVLLTGQDHFFSVGLDLIELYNYNEEQFQHFWDEFITMIYHLVAFDKPLVAAITGHAPAGGCVLSLCADYRIMAEGKYKIGLNEIPVGIIVPPSIFELYAFWLGKGKATQYLLEGKLHTVEEALNIGLLNETATLENVNEVAMNKLKQYVAFNALAWRATKRNCRADLINAVTPNRDEHFNNALKQWWNPEVRAALKAYIESFKSKK